MASGIVGMMVELTVANQESQQGYSLYNYKIILRNRGGL